jgi:CRP/FNR family transcriptional regulator
MEQLFRITYADRFEPELIEEIINVSKFVTFEEDDVLINYQQYIKSIPLLLSGAIKVLREDFDSGELLLYYLEQGDTCAVSITCCMGEKKSEIKAIGEKPGWIVMIPVGKMLEWTVKYKSWMNFVFQTYNNRFNELLNAVDTIAFMDMKDRLRHYLLEKSKITAHPVVLKTHQEIANDLNTSRVVISRLLKALEKENRIKLNRNNIEILLK